MDLLKTAFVNPCYLRSEEERRRLLGLNAENTALNLKDNRELQAHGQQFTQVRLQHAGVCETFKCGANTNKLTLIYMLLGVPL